MIVRRSRHIESSLDGPVQFFDFAGVACAHQPRQPVARSGEDVVEVCDAPDRQSLPATEDHFGREVADGTGDERNHDSAYRLEDRITSQDHDGSATDCYRPFPASRPTRLLLASRVGGLPVPDIHELVEQCGLRFSYLARVEIGDPGGLEVLPDGFVQEQAYLPALPCGKVPQLLLDGMV